MGSAVIALTMMTLRNSNIENTANPLQRTKGSTLTRASKTLSTITNITDRTGHVSAKPRQIRVARRLLKSQQSEESELQDEEESMDFETAAANQITAREELERRVALLTKPLPIGVTNIDKDDLENPQLCSEYAPEMYAYLRTIEHNFTVDADYLTSCPATGKMRTVLLDWLVDVQQQFKLLQETLYLTVSIIDRFMSTDGKDIKRNLLQLVGVTAMFLASKMEEIYAPELADFVYITDNAYTPTQVRAMEMRIVKALDYRFGEPLSINFLRRFSKAGDVDVFQHAMAKYVLEAILLDYNLVDTPASERAALSLYLSLGMLNTDTDELVWSKSLQYYSGYSASHLESKVGLVLESLKKVHLGKYTAVKQKYSSKLMHKIALHSDIKF